MFRSFIVFIVLVGFGFFVGVTQSDVVYRIFPALHREEQVAKSAPLIRCATEVKTDDWHTYRSDRLGIIFHYPNGYTVTPASEFVEITATSSGTTRSDDILLERLSGPFEPYAKDITLQAGWKVASRNTYALTTPFYSDPETGAFVSKYLFIKNFPQHGIKGTYIMFRATVKLGDDAQKQFEQARAAGIVDVETILTTPEQILSTFRFIEFDEMKDGE